MATRHQTLSDYEIQEILADSASESEAEIEGGGEEEDNYADMEVDEPEETSINFSASNRRTTRNQNIPSQIWSTGIEIVKKYRNLICDKRWVLDKDNNDREKERTT
ncbi:unnamed protein product [Rotaria sordida]|uniref:Uncharacterized protein n=1 Tax=Rotaria sordida TaxID=392033 RepID=A0A819D5A7_9BILA|nr:unnamed protein product [Rotaria sordida]